MKSSLNADSEILLIGQGYAGSLLAWMLINKGFKVTVADACPEFTSTKVAAGIMLPVTGRRLAKTHLADLIIPFARKTYSEIEKDISNKVFVEKEVLQIFSSIANLNEWYARSSEIEMQDYCGAILSKEQVHLSLLNDFGGILLRQSGYVEPLSFVKGVKDFIERKGSFKEATVIPSDLNMHETGVSWKGDEYSHLIFCEGYHSIKNPFFGYLPFKPAKGEILDFNAPELSEDYIISNGVYILPLGNSMFRTGATYVWDDLTEKTTSAGYEFLTANLKKTIRCNFEITGHKAGIRPAIRDRRPLVGVHPVHRHLGIFNGLGTKGATLGTYYGDQMFQLLTEGIQPDRDVNINQFDSLYQAT